jgi:hypothetical protein
MLAGGETLVYTPLPDFYGADQFVYYTSDGNVISQAATVAINVSAINDAPSFAKGTDPRATDQAGPQIFAGWAKNVSPGAANESGQQVHFVVVSNSNGALFAIPPAIDATGNLTFTPVENVTGQAEIRVRLVDDGGTADGGKDQSEVQAFTISVDFAFPLHNRILPADVTGDLDVVAEDAMNVINYINAHGSGPISEGAAFRASGLILAEAEGESTPIRYYDVTGDDYIAADDVMAIVNYINSGRRDAAFAGEGEATQPGDDILTLLATDAATQGKRRR